ncbi:hypothetical protein [Christiangramia forsetii]|uniref:Uncharacterized protein n=2 Tax=Christiangramia forsetii TaxID=411153 RepID=A0M448_CHRFK|nr:hypothetical protein [Christiangramia forsetii]GGG24258.1 hypothetical protein GCM10011532_04350 [Christiangramia forsetii]CAL67393.1 hypothetical protein GFO_2437 [Christiangramia forsetii KT0803]
MAVLDLSVEEQKEYSEGIDGVAIKKHIHGLEGGAVLNMTGFPDRFIFEGHGVIREDGEFKPQPVDGAKGALLVGVVRSTTRTAKPSTGVMTGGYFNNEVVKYKFNQNSLDALKALGIYNQPDY